MLFDLPPPNPLGTMEHLDLGNFFLRAPLLTVLVRSSDKRLEQWMRFKWLRFELRMELAADEMRMIRQFDHLHISPIRRRSGDLQSGSRHRLFVLTIELVPVPVALADLEHPIDSVCQRVRLDLARPCSQTHSAA